jgi:hypothetical protein
MYVYNFSTLFPLRGRTYFLSPSVQAGFSDAPKTKQGIKQGQREVFSPLLCPSLRSLTWGKPAAMLKALEKPVGRSTQHKSELSNMEWTAEVPVNSHMSEPPWKQVLQPSQAAPTNILSIFLLKFLILGNSV